MGTPDAFADLFSYSEYIILMKWVIHTEFVSFV